MKQLNKSLLIALFILLILLAVSLFKIKKMESQAEFSELLHNKNLSLIKDDWELANFKLTKQDLKRKNKSKTSILIVTDSLYEHGHWSKKERDLVLTSLLQTLDSHPEISFALKIHPSSEHISYYQSLIETLQINTHIYQQEILFDLIRDFDLVITYGYSTAHTQIISAEKKMILYDVNLPFRRVKLIDAGIKSGFVKVCSNVKDLIKIIDELQKHNVLIDDEFIKARNDLTFQFDGKSSERICNELLNLLKK